MNDVPLSDIHAAGHRHWIPIPLDRSADVFEAELRERLTGRGSAEEVELAVTLLSALAERLALPPGEDVPALNVAAWAFLADPDVLSFTAFATLRAARIGTEAGPEECVEVVLADSTLFQEPVVETLETRSGDATSVRYRPMVQEGEETQVHQVTAVLWPRPAQEMLYVLSSYATDLVEAAGVGDRLEELAAGMEGL